jgi:hypothetical protein
MDRRAVSNIPATMTAVVLTDHGGEMLDIRHGVQKAFGLKAHTGKAVVEVAPVR